MTLDDILKEFSSPSEAALVAGLGRTAGYHWYQDEDRRTVPAPRVLIIWADHFGLSDMELGQLIRDSNILRDKLIAIRCDIREMQRERGRLDAMDRHESRRREATESQQQRLEKKRAAADERIMRRAENQEKDDFLRLRAMQEELIALNRKLLSTSS